MILSSVIVSVMALYGGLDGVSKLWSLFGDGGNGMAQDNNLKDLCHILSDLYAENPAETPPDLYSLLDLNPSDPVFVQQSHQNKSAARDILIEASSKAKVAIFQQYPSLHIVNKDGSVVGAEVISFFKQGGAIDLSKYSVVGISKLSHDHRNRVTILDRIFRSLLNHNVRVVYRKHFVPILAPSEKEWWKEWVWGSSSSPGDYDGEGVMAKLRNKCKNHWTE